LDDSVYSLLREGAIDFNEASVHVVNREGLDAFSGAAGAPGALGAPGAPHGLKPPLREAA
jgi:hypothetical protein